MNIENHYKSLLAKYGDSPQATQYSDVETQELRFKYLLEIGDMSNKTILDFGCGTAHLATYLKSKDVNFDYIGVDIVPEFIELSKKKFPEFRFGRYEEFADVAVDYVIISGVFNNLMEDNRKFYQETISKLFKLASKGMAFNMMSSYVDYFDEGLFYEQPERVFSFIKNEITPLVTLRNDYRIKDNIPPFDFTMYLYK